MSDDYLRWGLPRWFSNYFRPDDQIFAYVGDRAKLIPVLTEKSWVRKALDIVLPHFSLGELLKVLASIPILTNPTSKNIGTDIIAALNEGDTLKTLAELLNRHYKRAKSKGRYFERVALKELDKNAVYRARFSAIQDKLITVEGHLLHRDTIQQFNRVAAVPVLKSGMQWLLSDFPPHCQSTGNDAATGEYLLLKEDAGFTAAFRDYLPFCPDIGWLPNVRVTGFFEPPRPPLATMPTLSIGMIEYRPPLPLTGLVKNLTELATEELQKQNYFDEWSPRILFAYLAPILFRGSDTPASEAPSTLCQS